MKAVVFLTDGFEEYEALIVVDILWRAGIEIIMVSITEQLEVEFSRHLRYKLVLCQEKVQVKRGLFGINGNNPVAVPKLAVPLY